MASIVINIFKPLTFFYTPARCLTFLPQRPFHQMNGGGDSDSEVERQAPVIVITGTPGTGKSTTAEMLVDASPIPLKHINVGDLVKERGLHEGYDKDWQSYLVDDDKVSVISVFFSFFVVSLVI